MGLVLRNCGGDWCGNKTGAESLATLFQHCGRRITEAIVAADVSKCHATRYSPLLWQARGRILSVNAAEVP
jgi:hypothetical protein